MLMFPSIPVEARIRYTSGIFTEVYLLIFLLQQSFKFVCRGGSPSSPYSRDKPSPWGVEGHLWHTGSKSPEGHQGPSPSSEFSKDASSGKVVIDPILQNNNPSLRKRDSCLKVVKPRPNPGSQALTPWGFPPEHLSTRGSAYSQCHIRPEYMYTQIETHKQPGLGAGEWDSLQGVWNAYIHLNGYEECRAPASASLG